MVFPLYRGHPFYAPPPWGCSSKLSFGRDLMYLPRGSANTIISIVALFSVEFVVLGGPIYLSVSVQAQLITVSVIPFLSLGIVYPTYLQKILAGVYTSKLT